MIYKTYSARRRGTSERRGCIYGKPPRPPCRRKGAPGTIGKLNQPPPPPHVVKLIRRAASTAATSTASSTNPTIAGPAQAGRTLSVGTEGIVDPDGLTSPTYGYQWIRVDGSVETDIGTETGSTYTPGADDLGKKLKVRVSFTDDASNPETRLQRGNVGGGAGGQHVLSGGLGLVR